jgi:PAS domain S-box-containing protein
MSAVVVEVDGSISFCNEHFASLVGYTREEIIGRDWIETFSPPDDEIDHLWLGELRQGRVLPHMTDQVVTRDGDVREITWSNTSLRDPQGRVVAAASIGEDVTDRLRAERALRDSETRRRRVVAEMLRTAEEERTRIAAELHDDTVQVMAATLLSLDRLGAALDAGDGDRAGLAARAARETLAAAVDRTRRLMFELRPPLLEAQGLDPALRDLAATAAAEAGFDVRADIRVGRYPEPVETLAYRTAQEAISNVRKHAQATRLELVLCDEAGGLRGEVTDDGCGFDPEQALDRRAMRLHMGLDAMMERVRLAGGEVDVRSQRGSGTSVRFRIPAA